jgi:hypothetical protein
MFSPARQVVEAMSCQAREDMVSRDQEQYSAASSVDAIWETYSGH